ncbi:MAG: chemotaxis protein CheW [Acidobacteriota bacterium]
MLQYCTFWVGELFIGIEVSRVQEVLSHSSITPVPLAPAHVKGLINLRGHIVTAIDMGLRLAIGAAGSADGETMHVILNDDQGLLSLIVDRAGDVVEVDRQAHEDPPDTLQGEARRLIRGAFKLEGRLLLDLDIDYAVAISE